MPAPKANKNAFRGGVSRLIRIYVPSMAAYEAIMETTTPEERGEWLFDAIRSDYLKCPICDKAMFECLHILEMENAE